ncbi:molecular chaperone LpfB [Enterobacteriaceae bacterium 89]|nr:molecular chaperone LpfB [Enterobacteriaceae bacterium 89]
MFRQLILTLLISSFSLPCFAAGVAVGATRVIYNASKKEASITVQNKSQKEDFLVQTWIDDANGNKKTPFIMTPPLFELDAGKNNILRIVKVKETLPQDRESVYWVNIKSIPPHNEENTGNVLQIAVRTRLKLFYRPAGLQGDPVSDAKQMLFSCQGNQLKITNPSVFNISFQELWLDGKEISHPGMVPAKGEHLLPLSSSCKSAAKVKYVVITDYGSASEAMTQSVR